MANARVCSEIVLGMPSSYAVKPDLLASEEDSGETIAVASLAEDHGIFKDRVEVSTQNSVVRILEHLAEVIYSVRYFSEPFINTFGEDVCGVDPHDTHLSPVEPLNYP